MRRWGWGTATHSSWNTQPTIGTEHPYCPLGWRKTHRHHPGRCYSNAQEAWAVVVRIFQPHYSDTSGCVRSADATKHSLNKKGEKRKLTTATTATIKPTLKQVKRITCSCDKGEWDLMFQNNVVKAMEVPVRKSRDSCVTEGKKSTRYVCTRTHLPD